MNRDDLIPGIDFLHSHNIVHRDLKPQNVLINRDQTVKLADFGLARSYSLQSAFTTIVVTLWYRAPELLLQCQYNTAVDMWSAGCILAELYSRVPLFNGQSEAEQLTIIFQKMGTPSVNAWPTDAVLDRSVYPSYPSVPLERQLPTIPAEGLHVISALLRFVASDRPSALDVLQSEYFVNGPICTFAS
uniref:Protein kinase domain-containing protein n=1 Tax=Plectus sambesii TaxID=2011161 RepID=A0A914W1A4_9BILA